MPDIRLIAIDLDGTLLRSDGSLSDASIGAVRRASARIPVILASARPPRSVRDIYRRLGLTTRQINYNGALTWDEPAGVVVDHRPVGPDVVSPAIRLARQVLPDCLVSIESLDRWFTDRVDPGFATATSRMFPPDAVAPLDSFEDQPTTKLMFQAAPHQIDELERRFESRFGLSACRIRTDADLLQLVREGVGKWPAVLNVAAGLEVAANQICTIGDNRNDLEMIASAGFGIAMANASEEIRSSAHWVAPTNDQDGVAVALDRILSEHN
jgi:5-amino-6-(5-phospho-D-ribitylamino)uracil phosphatase